MMLKIKAKELYQLLNKDGLILRYDKEKGKLLNSVFTTANKIRVTIENCEEQIEGQDQIQ